MPLFQVIFVLLIVGVGLWLINSYIPMQDNIKKILNIAVVVIVCIWLFQVLFGVGPGVGNIKVGP